MVKILSNKDFRINSVNFWSHLLAVVKTQSCTIREEVIIFPNYSK